MQKKKCQQIKTRVVEYLAPLNQGRVNLDQVYRLFSYLGSRSEIEKCMDDLVRSKLAKKVETDSGVSYIFNEIALEYGRKWKDGLENSKAEATRLQDEIELLETNIETQERMRDIWLEGWRNILHDLRVCSSVHNYISTVFFGQKIAGIFGEIEDKNRRLQTIRSGMKDLEKRIKASYHTI